MKVSLDDSLDNMGSNAKMTFVVHMTQEASTAIKLVPIMSCVLGYVIYFISQCGLYGDIALLGDRLYGYNRDSVLLWHGQFSPKYPQTSNIRGSLVGIKLVYHSYVVGASPVGAAPTTSSSVIEYLASMDWAKTTEMRWESFKFSDLVQLILEVLKYSQ